MGAKKWQTPPTKINPVSPQGTPGNPWGFSFPVNLHHHLGSFKAQDVANTVYGSLNLIQERPPAEQLVASCYLFLSLCAAFGIPANDVFGTVNNLMDDKAALSLPEFKALQNYMNNEIKPHAFV